MLQQMEFLLPKKIKPLPPDWRRAGQNLRKLYDLAKHDYKQQLNKAFLDLDAGQNGMLFG